MAAVEGCRLEGKRVRSRMMRSQRLCPPLGYTSSTLARLDMDLSIARADEAAALFDVNQRRRGHAEATLVLVAVLSLVVIATSIALDRPTVFLPLPPIALLLMSLAFQQYADVTVIGVARRHVERMVNATTGGSALVYETRIAGIRKRLPLVLGVRVLQGVAWAGIAGAVLAGVVIGADEAWWVLVVYAAVTLAAATSCALSFRDMHRAESVATSALGALEAASP